MIELYMSIEIIFLFFLMIFATSDLLTRRIPNELILAAAVGGVIAAGPYFLLRFLIGLLTSVLLRIILPEKYVLGGADLKVISLLYAGFGAEHLMYFLFFTFIFILIFNIPNKISDGIPVAAYILEGFLCVELLQL